MQLERRRQQRFPFQLELSIFAPSGKISAVCTTRDVSSKGVYFYADAWDASIGNFKFYAVLPPEVTLGSPLGARCSARVVRLERHRFNKVGVAAEVNEWSIV